MKQVKARYCVKKESNIFIPWSLESVDFKAFLDVWDALKIWFCDNFVTNGGKITDLQRRSILISWSAYAIMPVGKKDMTMFHVNKERTPVCTTNTCEGSSLFISVVERPLGYLLSLSCLSNHLQMRWQVTPAATVTIKVIKVFITLTSSRCRVSVGQHCKYNISLVILEVQTVLRSL